MSAQVDKMDALTLVSGYGSVFSHVEKGRVGIGTPCITRRPKAAPLNAAFSMVGRSGAPLRAPRLVAVVPIPFARPPRLEPSVVGFGKPITRKAVMDEQRTYYAKIRKLQNALLTADGLIKAIDQLSVEALESSDVCNAVHCLIETLQRLSTESINLADQLIASGRGR
jgi:hypothetical protein